MNAMIELILDHVLAIGRVNNKQVFLYIYNF